MGAGIILALRQELMVTGILFVLLVMKIGATELRTGVVLNIVNVLLLANVILGCFGGPDSSLFNGMFHSNRLIGFEIL